MHYFRYQIKSTVYISCLKYRYRIVNEILFIIKLQNNTLDFVLSVFMKIYTPLNSKCFFLYKIDLSGVYIYIPFHMLLECGLRDIDCLWEQEQSDVWSELSYQHQDSCRFDRQNSWSFTRILIRIKRFGLNIEPPPILCLRTYHTARNKGRRAFQLCHKLNQKLSTPTFTQ